MNTKILLLGLALSASPAAATAAEPPYAVESLAAIIQELSRDAYEEPFKAWLKEHRPAQFRRLFEPSQETEETQTDENDAPEGLFAQLAAIEAAIAKPQIALLDYYVNQKAAKGWEVVSVSESIILFRRVETRVQRPDDKTD